MTDTRLSPTVLGRLVMRALEASSGRYLAQTSLNRRPLLINGDRALRIFVWNIRPGGRHRSEAEMRVQTTRPGDVAFNADPSRTTLLLGYDAHRDVFAAWDVRRHPNPRSSSSLQVPDRTLEHAARAQIAFHHRETEAGDEVVYAFVSPLLATYIDARSDLLSLVEGLEQETAERVLADPTAPPPPIQGQERRRVARRVTVAVRDHRFAAAVVHAYDYACAFCGLGAGLVDAAHILAVEAGGLDIVENGLAACPTHHRAFDKGLISVNDAGGITLDHERARKLGVAPAELRRLGRGMRRSLRSPREAESRPASRWLRAHRDALA